jgi:hypothetical protein
MDAGGAAPSRGGEVAGDGAGACYGGPGSLEPAKNKGEGMGNSLVGF